MKNYLIAGANSGIGLETAKLLLSSGDHHIISAGRNHDKIGTLDRVNCIDFDATKNEAPKAETDQLDGFVYAAGTINLKPFHRFTEEELLDDLRVNWLGAVKLLQANLDSLKKSGNASIVFFSTVAVQTGMPFHASIASAKGAIEGLTRSLAIELAPKIRVNCIAPSLTDTPLAANLLNSPEKAEASANRHPLKRVGSPKETAKLVQYLLGDDSGFMTGQILGLDGGLSCLRPL